MKQFLLFAWLFILPYAAIAQVNDDFSDGNFSSNPAWSGDVAEFKVNSSNQLQLNSSGENESYLVTTNSLADSVEWIFWVKQSFSPSSNNNSRVYLMSDVQDIKNAQPNGYYLQLGESGSNDAIELFRQNGANSTSICRGTDGLISGSFEMRVKVIRDSQGKWSILADPAGNQNYQLEATGNDNTFNSTAYFGFLCDYTKTNADNFYFDDVVIKQYTPDVTPPAVKNIGVLNAQELSIEFSESVTQATAEDPSNYSVNQGFGSPSTAAINPQDPRAVKLTFSGSFASAQQYQLDIQQIEDVAGNVLDTTVSFTFYEAARGDVVINEIMADPTPQVALPDAEYLEIYNDAPYPVNLNNWTLIIGSSRKNLGALNLNPGSFLILCDDDDEDVLKSFGNIYSFSSFSLTNGGASVTLKNHLSQVIHHVAYTDAWYKDPVKEDGGWALEQMDPDNACAGVSNWLASVETSGGTPGKENSVKTPNPDILPPSISNISILDSSKIRLTFSEAMDSVIIRKTGIYTIDNGIGNPDQVRALPPAYKSVELELPAKIQPNVLYTLNVTDTLMDCAGNPATGLSFQFAHFEAQFQDVVISEIMCDPSDQKGLPEVEYVEVHNRTGFPVNLGGWKFSYSGNAPKKLENQVILPDSFLIICDDDDKAAMQAYGPVSSVSSLSLPNSGSRMILKDSLNRIISTVEYTDSWYKNDFKKEQSGWALEMKDTDYPCMGYENWKASKSPEGGTPAKVNSVKKANPDNNSPEYLSSMYVNASMFMIEFDEILNPGKLPEAKDLEIQGMGKVLNLSLIEPEYNKLQIVLPSALAKDTVYNLIIKDSVTDCAGNLLKDTVIPLAVPELPGKEDLLINEVLFEAPDAADDFVEIVNNSGKALYLYNMNMALINPEDYTDISEVELDAQKRIMFDGDIWVFTQEKRGLSDYYPRSIENHIWQKKYLPALNADEGIILIKNSFLGEMIDSLYYKSEMHNPILKETKGVSLERISYDLSSQNDKNWISAAETAGFATPGQQNSQFNRLGSSKSGEISLKDRLFSPNGDGNRDVLVINYHMDKAGYVGNVRIYDRNGREVRELENNVLMEKQGSFIWDGITDNAEKAPIGIYLVFVEVFDLGGKVESYTKTAVLGGRLE